MKVKDIKKWIVLLPDDLDINFVNGNGFQEITCLTDDKTLCFSNDPYGASKEDITLHSIASIAKHIQTIK